NICHIDENKDSSKWSKGHRKYYGEFIRRHHARIAHEIALFGYPHNEGKGTVEKRPDKPVYIRDLAGFVARSHNMSLRDTYPYLIKKYKSIVDPYKTHPIYLMVLLRIADYLQIEKVRTNEWLLGVQYLRSPISQEEWDVHLAVEDVKRDDNDEEALSVVGKPKDATTFLKLKKLLKGLQTELDTSWAVMGEVYSKQKLQKDFGISLRRVKSNLDDEKKFIEDERPAYYPMHAAFDTEGASLLKLLIKPLYGDRPEIGVRELLQNSLDAVREMRKYCEMHNIDMKTLPFPEQEADVLISIDKHEDGNHYLTITDKGIGMTAETVRDYFLKAGASFRQSDYWQKEFTKEGKSTVLRSGRFGIGALAALLLGDRMEVGTRHIDAKEEDGVGFEAGLNENQIHLLRETKLYFGTQIKIHLNEVFVTEINLMIEAIEGEEENFLILNWYVLQNPSVEIRLFGKILSQEFHFPDSYFSSKKNDWRKIIHKDYSGIYWSYNIDDVFNIADKNEPKMPIGGFVHNDFLALNGIIVRYKENQESEIHWWKNDISNPFYLPTICVFDKRFQFPLNLTRDSLESNLLPFHEELIEDLTKDFCAYLLLHLPSGNEHAQLITSYPFSNASLKILFFISLFSFTREGFLLNHPWHIIKHNLKVIVHANPEINFKHYPETMNYPTAKLDSTDLQMLNNTSPLGFFTEIIIGNIFNLDQFIFSGVRLISNIDNDMLLDKLRSDLMYVSYRDKERAEIINQVNKNLVVFPITGEKVCITQFGKVSFS
ncbi:MAG: hypothetical protein EPO24_09135, partial [Bacteroidetes bacterium]